MTTTPATEPLLQAAQLQPGRHITAVGSDTPRKQELDAHILACADVVVADSIAQCLERGEIHQAIKAGLLTQDRLVEFGVDSNAPICRGVAKGVGKWIVQHLAQAVGVALNGGTLSASCVCRVIVLSAAGRVKMAVTSWQSPLCSAHTYRPRWRGGCLAGR